MPACPQAYSDSEHRQDKALHAFLMYDSRSNRGYAGSLSVLFPRRNSDWDRFQIHLVTGLYFLNTTPWGDEVASCGLGLSELHVRWPRMTEAVWPEAMHLCKCMETFCQVPFQTCNVNLDSHQRGVGRTIPQPGPFKQLTLLVFMFLHSTPWSCPRCHRQDAYLLALHTHCTRSIPLFKN